MNQSVFQSNLKQLGRFCPFAVPQIEQTDASHLEWCETEKGEVNLKRVVGSNTYYFHSPQGALIEAQQWLNEVFPIDKQVLFIYGVGLGYYYDVLQEWLNFNPRRFIIFLEDDLALIKRFLETEKASKILHNPQVIFQYIPPVGEKDWGNFRKQFEWICEAFVAHPWSFSALKLYQEERNAEFTLIRNQFAQNLRFSQIFFVDLINNFELVNTNFYRNLALLADSYQIPALYDKFPNLPFLICGAGPSLSKQIDTIRTLEDKAVILGSATGLNVLNRQGIFPHFGLCIDPYDIQESRQLTNFAYETPFFYQNRFFHRGLTKIHGPRIYLGSTIFGRISLWFNEQLELPSYRHLEQGLSTSNIFAYIAGALAANPVVLVGLDMAYTSSTRYAAGVATHATDTAQSVLFNLEMSEETVAAPSAEGETVQTHWTWIGEAGEFTEFAKKNPQLSFINCTEGGMKILDVAHLPFQSVVQRRMSPSYDIQNWIHAELQQARPALKDEKVLQAMEKWLESIKVSQEILKKLENDLAEFDTLSLELEEQPFFKNFLHLYDGQYSRLTAPEIKKIDFFPDQFDEETRSKIILDEKRGRIEFLKHYADLSARIVDEAIASFRTRILQKARMAKEIPPISRPKAVEGELYSYEKGILIIRDPEFNLSIEEDFNPERVSEERKKAHRDSNDLLTVKPDKFEGQALLLYPDGKIKGEMFYHNDALHGPSSFYLPDGTLIARSWFYQGKRVGKSWQYYPSGQIYSLQRYKEGIRQGRQHYYYPNGVLKTDLNFQEGLLEGDTWLYFPNGKPKRTQRFVKGKLNGTERLWNEDGQLITQAEYRNNLPYGMTRTWHDNGQLSKEVVFYDDPTNYDLKLWDEHGRLVNKKTSLPSHPLEDVFKKSKDLQNVIDSLSQQIVKLKENE